MKIGITGVGVDLHNLDAKDLVAEISRLGNKPELIYADSLDVSLGRGGVDIFQSSDKASGAGSERKMLEPEAVILRHLGTIRDYEQLTYRLSCMMAFEEKGIYVMNPVMNWLFGSDKFATLLKLKARGLPVPDTEVTEKMFVGYDAVKKFKRAVLKPLRSAMGFGVFRVDDPDLALYAFSYFTNMSKPIYVQRFLEKKGGGDYRLVVVGGEVIGSEFRKGVTWKSNVAQGARPIAAKADEEMQELAVRSAEILGLEYAGIDIAETKDGYFVLETNPTLSWQGFKRAVGINPAKSIVAHIVKKARG